MDLTIGSKIKIKRTEYTIVVEFNDDNKKYFVGKYKMSCGVFSYKSPQGNHEIFSFVEELRHLLFC